MNKVMSATDARIHFGELMRHVVENDVPVFVEKLGKPQVVVLSVGVYERLRDASVEGGKDTLFQEILSYASSIQVHDRSPLPAPEAIIQQMREERDAQLLDNLS